MTRSKAFFLNGGAGRMLCSIPALELYEQESGDKDFVIVCEGGTDMFKGHPNYINVLMILGIKTYLKMSISLTVLSKNLAGRRSSHYLWR